MNEVRRELQFAVIKFYYSIMNVLYEKCNKHNAKAERVLDELERYGAER